MVLVDAGNWGRGPEAVVVDQATGRRLDGPDLRLHRWPRREQTVALMLTATRRPWSSRAIRRVAVGRVSAMHESSNACEPFREDRCGRTRKIDPEGPRVVRACPRNNPREARPGIASSEPMAAHPWGLTNSPSFAKEQPLPMPRRPRRPRSRSMLAANLRNGCDADQRLLQRRIAAAGRGLLHYPFPRAALNSCSLTECSSQPRLRRGVAHEI